MAGYGNGGAPPRVLARMDEASAGEAFGDVGVSGETWAQYASTRAHVAPTAQEEAAATILRNRAAILADASKRGCLPDEEQLDPALRALAGLLASGGGEAAETLRGIAGVAALAAFLDGRMCVPRDMGAPAAAALKRLAAELNT